MVLVLAIIGTALLMGAGYLISKNKSLAAMRETPGMGEAARGETMQNVPEVGLTMADGKPEDDAEEKK
ncbi:MAG: hypothetical protein GF419_07860 [Ignavibacteriales bacterium]|jgi:hypothetical protein|nr:hypothetical protein [Ignavibacteriales bacterium]